MTQMPAQLESEVRSYCRTFPAVFARASGATLVDVRGRRYIDFFSGAGTLNYGHNPKPFKQRLLDYLHADGIAHGLDMATEAKQAFMETFDRTILRPRSLNYRMQFTGPTGANAVEAALKLARNVTGRNTVVAFTHAFHGVTLGALAATAGSHYRKAGGLAPAGSAFLPYDGYLGPGVDTTELFDRLLCDGGSGLDHPAAVIVETIQGEGGVNVASFAWLRALAEICRRHHILLIVDDIQAGCGRTGPFFSFEEAGLVPDIVTLSKSLSGYGMPFSMVLLKPELDAWKPGEHNGTFRGNNLAFVTARAALDEYWRDDALTQEVRRKGRLVRGWLQEIAGDDPRRDCTVRGRGMMQGLDCRDGDLAGRICTLAFENGLVIERSGSDGRVVKFLGPLTIADDDLAEGLRILRASAARAFAETVFGRPGHQRDAVGAAR
jgi:diaminobutyrate-2-oxoglutarate transaminase